MLLGIVRLSLVRMLLGCCLAQVCALLLLQRRGESGADRLLRVLQRGALVVASLGECVPPMLPLWVCAGGLCLLRLGRLGVLCRHPQVGVQELGGRAASFT